MEHSRGRSEADPFLPRAIPTFLGVDDSLRITRRSHRLGEPVRKAPISRCADPRAAALDNGRRLPIGLEVPEVIRASDVERSAPGKSYLLKAKCRSALTRVCHLRYSGRVP
jgi:hypothetical protein